MPHHNSQIQYGIQSFNAGQYQHSFPVYSSQNTFMMPNPNQMQHVNTSDGPASGPTEEENTEKMKVQLRKRKIPEENCRYYIEAPEHWDFEDISQTGLQKGIEAILMSPNTVTPCWVEKESVDRFVKIKMKLTAIAQATAEIDRFVEEDMPDDNQLAAAHKQAGKRAEKLQADLQTACNELTAMTVVVDDCFGASSSAV